MKTGSVREREGDDALSPPSMPRWVKLFAIVAGIVLLLMVAAMFFGGGRHGPGRHIHGTGIGVSVAAVSASE